MGAAAVAPGTLELALRAEQEPPVHVPYATWGERIDEIKVSDAYLRLGAIGVSAGVTALPYEESELGASARVVWGALISLWGPSSALYSCPVAMTDAAARTLLVHGGPSDVPVVERLVSRDPERAWTSGQWMTETAGKRLRSSIVKSVGRSTIPWTIKRCAAGSIAGMPAWWIS